LVADDRILIALDDAGLVVLAASPGAATLAVVARQLIAVSGRARRRSRIQPKRPRWQLRKPRRGDARAARVPRGAASARDARGHRRAANTERVGPRYVVRSTARP